MYLFYVDESGDTGLERSPTRYFCLSALVVHELRWHDLMGEEKGLRRDLRQNSGLKLREEIHAAHFIHRPGDLARIAKSLRLRILRQVLDFQSRLNYLSVVNVVVDKQGKRLDYDVFEHAWRALIQRIDNTIQYRNFPGPANPDERGIIIADRTDERKLRLLTRRMGVYNPVPSRITSGYRNLPLVTVVEDAVHRDSSHSLLIQLADVNAYFLYQKLQPCTYIRRRGCRNYFDRLNDILCTVASSSDPQGIVRL